MTEKETAAEPTVEPPKEEAAAGCVPIRTRTTGETAGSWHQRAWRSVNDEFVTSAFAVSEARFRWPVRSTELLIGPGGQCSALPVGETI